MNAYWHKLFIKSKLTSRKSSVFKFVLTVMLSSQILKIWIICFLLGSTLGPFRNLSSSSSRYKPTFFFLITVLYRCRMLTPTNLQNSAPSKHSIGISNSSSPNFFSQGSLLLNNNVFSRLHNNGNISFRVVTDSFNKVDCLMR